MFGIVNGRRLRIFSSNDSVIVQQTGQNFDLEVNVAAVVPTLTSTDGSIDVQQTGPSTIDLTVSDTAVDLTSPDGSIDVVQTGRNFTAQVSTTAVDVASADGSVDIVQTGRNFDLAVSNTAVDLTSPDGSIDVVQTGRNFTAQVSNTAVDLTSPDGSIDVVQTGRNFTAQVSNTAVDVASADGSIDVVQTGRNFDLAVSTSAVDITSPDGSIDVVQTGRNFTLEVDTAVIDSWELVREIDMSTWASTDFASGGDGTYTLGGLTWTAGSTANANAGLSTGGFFRRNSGDVGDDGGGGLRIFPDQSITNTLSRATQTSPRLTIPLSSLIPNMDNTAEYLFQLELTRFDDNGLTFSVAPTAMMALYQAAGTPAGSAARFDGVALQRSATDNGQPTVSSGNSTRLPITSLTYQNGDNVIAMQCGGVAQVVSAYSGRYSGGAWPEPVDLTGVGTTSENIDNGAVSPPLDRNSLLEIGVASNASQTGSVDVMFRRLRVLRKRP